MHNIEIKENGKASYVGVGEPAWHGLGTTFTDREGLTADEVVAESGQNYHVIKRPVQFEVKGKKYESPSKFVICREDTHAYLGICGTNWTPLQNAEAFKFFDAIVDRGEAIYHTAGVLGKGERSWILAKLPAYIRVGDGDIIEQYALVSNIFTGHDAIEIALVDLRVVCQNTLMAALAGAKGKRIISIPHTKDVVAQVQKAHEGLGLFSQYSKDIESAFKAMAKVKITDAILREYLDKLLPKSISESESSPKTMSRKNRAKIEEFFETGIGQDTKTARGTAFGLYQAVTGFASHVKEYKDDAAKFRNLLIGGASYRMNQKAFELALELV